MSVFLVILAILGGLLLLFGLLLLLRVGVQLRYDGSFSVKLKVLFLSFTLFPKKEKLRIKGQLPSEKKAKKEKKKKQKKEKAVSKKPDFSEMFSFYRQLFTEVILPALGRFLKHLHLRVDQLQIEIASEDAAKTALLYGSAVSGGTAFLEFLRNITHLKMGREEEIYIRNRFDKIEGSCRVRITLSLCLWQAVHILLPALMKYLLLQQKKEQQVEKETLKQKANIAEK